MEWTALAILVIVMAIGVAVFAVFNQFLATSRENNQHYKKILQEISALSRQSGGAAKAETTKAPEDAD